MEIQTAHSPGFNEETKAEGELHLSASPDDALKVQPCFQLLPMDAQKEWNVLAMYILSSCSLSKYI